MLLLKAFSRVFNQRGPGFNFTNVLREAFTHADPESAKKDNQVFLCFWDLRV